MVQQVRGGGSGHSMLASATCHQPPPPPPSLLPTSLHLTPLFHRPPPPLVPRPWRLQAARPPCALRWAGLLAVLQLLVGRRSCQLSDSRLALYRPAPLSPSMPLPRTPSNQPTTQHQPTDTQAGVLHKGERAGWAWQGPGVMAPGAAFPSRAASADLGPLLTASVCSPPAFPRRRTGPW